MTDRASQPERLVGPAIAGHDRLADVLGRLTQRNVVAGAAQDMSPGQAGARATGPASDVYSFGVVLDREGAS